MAKFKGKNGINRVSVIDREISDLQGAYKPPRDAFPAPDFHLDIL